MTPANGNHGFAADELAIRNLLANIAQLTDYGDLDSYLDLYTDDGVWEMATPNPQVGIGPTRHSGRDDMREGIEERRKLGIQGPLSNTMHITTTTAVQFSDPDTAIASSFWMYFAETNETPILRSMGHYEDELRYTSAGWRLAYRRVTAGGPPRPGWRPGAPLARPQEDS